MADITWLADTRLTSCSADRPPNSTTRRMRSGRGSADGVTVLESGTPQGVDREGCLAGGLSGMAPTGP